MENIVALILAAGKGTRMQSKLPKVLHAVGGIPMVGQVLRTVTRAGITRKIVVIGFGGDEVASYLQGKAETVIQAQQLGTGHAVLQAESLLKNERGILLVTCGDTPLVRPETFKELIAYHQSMKASATVLTTIMPDATGYGRIIRNQEEKVVKIVEQKDCTDAEKKVQEVNTGIYCFDLEKLWGLLHNLTNTNAQGEYYLTDVISLLVQADQCVAAYAVSNYSETLGVNSRVQLAEAEQILRMRKLHSLMEMGVTIIDPHHTYVDMDVQVGKDTILYPGTILQGDTTIGDDCVIGPYTRLENVRMGNGNHIQFTYAHDCEIKNHCEVGPFVHFRPQTVIGNHVKVGNYMEVKNSFIGDNSKLPHLSYIGDSDVGQGVNIGCGTITVNFNGREKHRTVIKDHAFIGCNSNLVAPVQVGERAFVAAGTTVTKNVPADSLSVSRTPQRNIDKWVTEQTYKK
ncbi:MULTISPECIES: bifunctional UDP-N-acetylglucosamine diphosphorylase/glucosamine-1-phosphate N-acetyltransferase GlmU [Megasphaera]|uniref:Bifunctional protein GlmU n=1 Tax=Megasphaera hutchinsoni TaxID=1588748 RepID=A0A134CEB9_9FIRM|nr:MULTISPECIES: bifunctional UDP-N-acetylglucosamine diphosphorylase/glucosamine-1-phosphate N-acetyltransferase GlmU [Megasphaera]EGS32223.1 UDP-N-acetylglucosamine diphosphorylase/glucosamine-1-phosphate N-acetyltransferase [Megasphaera sp. UPII 135-E]KXB90566.1 UDP-N-acetylglucosamine diphosphorylase/glucosamine-1-phosphate N-acetyltransferase [Megasphaera hutchinsoni]MUP48871.1 bifunctional UDP-N-acetylglucosamine diphosphorylase/glucosamine-1-phosphate N-acetyltransferase GlmU [Veillonella